MECRWSSKSARKTDADAMNVMHVAGVHGVSISRRSSADGCLTQHSEAERAVDSLSWYAVPSESHDQARPL